MAPNFRISARPALAAALIGAFLASCSEGALLSGSGESASVDVASDREVRDAAVFQKTATALWDGRPSLGGVWIAHPDATTPERVEIRVDATGKTVQAALFRRERDFPGPPFQLSSDAAVALRVVAGTPTTVTVTALRREPVAPPPIAEPKVAADAAITEDPALAAADAAIDEALAPDAIDLAEAAVEPAAAGSAGSSLFASKPKNTGVNAPADESLAAEGEAMTPAAEALAAPETATETAVAAVAPEPEPKAGSAGSSPGNKPTLVDDAGEPIPLESSSLEPITATEIQSAPLPEQPAATPEAALESAVVPEPAPGSAAASDLERPFVQVASGSTKANVEALVAKLVAAGLPAALRETTQDGKPLYYAVVGPAGSEAELNANLARVRELGYPEAFIAKG